MRRYHRRVHACRVRHRHESSVEIVQVDLAPGLEFVDEVKKAKGKGGAGARPGRWEPPGIEKLSAAVAIAILFAKAVGDPYCMYTGNVEQCEIDGIGGEGADVVNAVTELVGKT